MRYFLTSIGLIDFYNFNFFFFLNSVSQLEFPTPERLLPIGQHGKDGISALVERVREALAIPDNIYMRQDSLEKSEVNKKKNN